MAARWAGLARDTAIVGAVSLGLFLVLELGLRVFAPQSLQGTSLRGEHFSAEDSILGYRYVPGAVWRFRHPEYSVEYAINGQGFRDATAHPVPKPPGTIRVLLIGDSFTFGQGVAYDRIWPVLAERELQRRGGPAIDLVKAGVQGMDTRSELVLLRRHARRLDVDAVVVGFLVNDLYTNLPYAERPDTEASDSSGDWTKIRSTVFVEARRDRTFHLVTLARRLVTANDEAYVGLYLAAQDRGGFLRLPLGATARRQLAVTEGLFDDMASFCDSIGVRLIVLSIPQQFQVLYQQGTRKDARVAVDYYDRHFSAFAARRGFPWIPTLPAFAAAPTSTELFYRLDGHLTEAGNAVLARHFLDTVVPLLESPTRAP